MNAKLEIHRKFSILGWAPRVHIWIDGREVVAIANGKTASMEVPPGTHVIATKLGNRRNSGTVAATEIGAALTVKKVFLRRSRRFRRFRTH